MAKATHPKPTIGRIVLVTHENDEAPAVINRVESDTAVAVTVFPYGGAPYPRTVVNQSADGEREEGCWRWPPRDEKAAT